MPAAVESDLCVGCETCVDECPAEAITMEDGIAKVNKEKCTECKTCVDICPSAAIKVELSVAARGEPPAATRGESSMDGLEQRLKKMATHSGPTALIGEIIKSVHGPLFMPQFESLDDAVRFERSIPYNKRKGTISYIIGGVVFENGKVGYVVVTGGAISGNEALSIFNQILRPETHQKGCSFSGWDPPNK